MSPYSNALMTETVESDIDDTLGGRLVSARESVGLTTAQLARRLGVKSATLQNWESDRSEPRSNKLFMLAGLLNVSPTWLINGVGEAPSQLEPDGNLMALRDQLSELHEQSQRLTQSIEHTLAQLERKSG